MKGETVDAYLAALTPPRRKALERVRKIIHAAAPGRGTVRFLPEKPIPAPVIRRIVKARVERITG